MTTPTPEPAPVPEPVPAPVPVSPPAVPRQGFGTWLEQHLVPGLKDLAADAEKARTVIPLIEAYLPKITAAAEADPAVAAAIAPLVKEAEEILAVIAGL
jgi:hypothetical protein